MSQGHTMTILPGLVGDTHGLDLTPRTIPHFEGGNLGGVVGDAILQPLQHRYLQLATVSLG